MVGTSSDRVSLFAGLQEKVLEDRLACRLTVEALTPVWIGGFDTGVLHGDLGAESLRASSIKGAWRWWARSLVSAALYEITGGFPNINQADELVSVLLGKGGEKAHQSLYQIVVKVSEDKEGGIKILEPQLIRRHRGGSAGSSMSRAEAINEVARVKLSALRREPGQKHEISFIDTGSKFVVTLYRQAEAAVRGDARHLSEAFAIHSLVLSLTLGGVGKATTRGFGRFALVSADIVDKRVREKIGIDYVKEFKEVSNPDDAKGLTRKLVEIGVGLAKTFLNEQELIHNVKQVNPAEKLPVFETPAQNFIIIDAPNKLFANDIQALEAIGRATLKHEWRKVLGTQAYEKRRDLHTWVLGLPRAQSLLFDGELAEYVDKLREKLTEELVSHGCSHENAREIASKIGIRSEGREKDRGSATRKVSVLTGYIDCKMHNVIRRKSPIIFIPFKINSQEASAGSMSQEGSGYCIVILAFKTNDWRYSQLKHIGFSKLRRDAVAKEGNPFEVSDISTRYEDVDRAVSLAVKRARTIIEKLGESNEGRQRATARR